MKAGLQASGSMRAETLPLRRVSPADAEAAIRSAATSLLHRQYPNGYWCADLTADTTLESDYILTQLWLHPPVDGEWNPPTRPQINRAVEAILARQLPDGGFNIYSHGPSEVSASIKAYVGLKLGGLRTDDDRMRRLRERILAQGGIEAANSYVRVNLSLFNLYPRENCPAIPPELVLWPGFIYQMSSWTRAIVLSLAIVYAADPKRPVPSGFTLDELHLPGAPTTPARGERYFGWRNFFLRLDRVLKVWDRVRPNSLRELAVRRCAEWMLERLEGSDGLGAIYPSMQYSIMALDVLGYAPEHPLRERAEAEFNRLMVDDPKRGFFMQPCFSPVWDTAIAAYALGESGVAPEAALRRVADWFLEKEVRRKGDWTHKRPGVESSGWAFEFNNEFYPDVDDTAMVLLAFQHAHATDEAAQRECSQRAIAWTLAMQSKDGGWAAFDADNNWNVLSHVPFADHNAMLDPSCPDITGRVLEALVKSGVAPEHPAVKRGVQYLLGSQCADGSWFGRWGVNYIYGTFLAIRGLRAAGLSENEPSIQRALEFIRAYQNMDGGWGESCASYDLGGFLPNPSTPSQTAWAILALLAGGDLRSESLYTGVQFLLRTQRPDGNWDEDFCTGTGFPRVFYLCYTEYRNMFPLLALATFTKAIEALNEEAARGSGDRNLYQCAAN